MVIARFVRASKRIYTPKELAEKLNPYLISLLQVYVETYPSFHKVEGEFACSAQEVAKWKGQISDSYHKLMYDYAENTLVLATEVLSEWNSMFDLNSRTLNYNLIFSDTKDIFYKEFSEALFLFYLFEHEHDAFCSLLSESLGHFPSQEMETFPAKLKQEYYRTWKANYSDRVSSFTQKHVSLFTKKASQEPSPDIAGSASSDPHTNPESSTGQLSLSSTSEQPNHPHAEKQDPWDFNEPGKVSFNGHSFKITGKQKTLLEAFASAGRRYIMLEKIPELFENHDENLMHEPKSIQKTVSDLRGTLRRAFTLPDEKDPIPHSGSGRDLGYRLDKDLLNRALSQLRH